MRVVDRRYQEEFINRDPSFWIDLVASVQLASKERSEFQPLNTMWEHQEQMYDKALGYIHANGTRGRIICATGGGKTEVEFRLVKTMFQEGAQLCIVVAPTIDLLIQHHKYFEKFGTFHGQDKISVIHFRTGDEAREDSFIDYAQMTVGDDFNRIMVNNSGKKVLIFVTYASEQKLFNLMRNNAIVAGLCIWDEFHHTVRQDVKYLDHLKDLPVKHNLFFSASQKRGRIVSSFDESVYGPELESISYKELREKGVLVPRIIIKPIRINTNGRRLGAIGRELSETAKREKFDLRNALIEAASCIVAREDLLTTIGRSNIVTFSKGVPICKAIVNSHTIRAEINNALLSTVYAGVPGRDRKSIYESVKLSDDSILCQYSVVKEGIDITPFNAMVASRVLDIIGTQQGLGRIVRAEPQDTKALKAGTISLDSPVGWKKYYSIVYVIIHDDSSEQFKSYLQELVRKLQGSGLTPDDYQFGEIIEPNNGTGDPKPGPDTGYITEIIKDFFPDQTLQEYVRAMQVQMEEDEEQQLLQEEIAEASKGTIDGFFDKMFTW